MHIRKFDIIISYSVLDEDFFDYFGFSGDEVAAILETDPISQILSRNGMTDIFLAIVMYIALGM